MSQLDEAISIGGADSQTQNPHGENVRDFCVYERVFEAGNAGFI